MNTRSFRDGGWVDGLGITVNYWGHEESHWFSQNKESFEPA